MAAADLAVLEHALAVFAGHHTLVDWARETRLVMEQIPAVIDEICAARQQGAPDQLAGS